MYFNHNQPCILNSILNTSLSLKCPAKIIASCGTQLPLSAISHKKHYILLLSLLLSLLIFILLYVLNFRLLFLFLILFLSLLIILFVLLSVSLPL